MLLLYILIVLSAILLQDAQIYQGTKAGAGFAFPEVFAIVLRKQNTDLYSYHNSRAQSAPYSAPERGELGICHLRDLLYLPASPRYEEGIVPTLTGPPKPFSAQASLSHQGLCRVHCLSGLFFV